MNKYIIRCKNPVTDSYYTKEVEGRPVEIIDGYEFFLHETTDCDDHLLAEQPWTVSEKSTGRVVARGRTTESTIGLAKENVLGAGDRFPSMIARMIEVNKGLFDKKHSDR